MSIMNFSLFFLGTWPAGKVHYREGGEKDEEGRKVCDLFRPLFFRLLNYIASVNFLMDTWLCKGRQKGRKA